MKKLIALVLALVMCLGMFAGCASTSGKTPATEKAPAADSGNAPAADAAVSGESSLKGKRVRVVIGSTSTGGDSYMIADMVTRYLGKGTSDLIRTTKEVPDMV